MKRKRNIPLARLSIHEVHESPSAMDMDELIEEPSWSAQRLLKTKKIVEAIIIQELEIFEEESITLHHTTFKIEYKRLLIKKIT